MPSHPTTAGHFRVMYRLGSDDAPVPAGTLAIDAANRLELQDAEERFRKLLTRAVKDLNGRAVFTVATPPPEGAPRHGTYGRQVPRDSAEAPEALRTVLATEFGLELQPA